MSSTSQFAFQAKAYNEAFAFKSSLWKLQKWLNHSRARCKSASPSPSSTISKSSGTAIRNKRKQETENSFRSIVEELQTMVASHKRKHKIHRVRKKPTKSYALSRALKNIGENLNLSLDDEVEEDQNITKIILGSKHNLSQFLLQIAFNTKTCDVILDECFFEITLCQKEDILVDIEFDGNATKSMMNDLKHIIDNGDFDKLHTKLLLNKYFDDFHNYFPSLLLSDLKEEDHGAQTIPKQIELCMKPLPNVIEYKRLLDGPSVVYAAQIMDCILTKIKPPHLWRISFVGLYPQKCIANTMTQLDHNKGVTINPIIANNKEIDKDKQALLYWFVLKPSVIVPLQIAREIFTLCVGSDVFEWHQLSTKDVEDAEKRSTHSSWVEQTYSFHQMLIGDMDLKYRKAIELFENDYQYFKFKPTEYNSHGVRIDQIPIYDLKYVNEKRIHESTLCKVINQLKNWAIINQLYAQCFHHNHKKWKVKTENKLDKIYHRYEINIQNSNHLEITHLVHNARDVQKSKSNMNSMDIDDDDNIEGIDEDKYRNEYKLPPKVDDWIADFCIDANHNINVHVKYWILNTEEKTQDNAAKMETDTESMERPNGLQIDTIYDKKVSEILQKTNSIPITLCYISKLFDGRYLNKKLQCERLKQQHQKQQMMEDDTDHMIDVD